MPSPTCLPLLLIAALAISMTTGEIPECSSFQFAVSHRCYYCPFKGLAMPRGIGCFEQLFVKRSIVCSYQSCRHGVAQVARAHDLRRDDDFNSSNSEVTGATSLIFHFSPIDRLLDVERFLVWKKIGCEVGVANYTFYSMYRRVLDDAMAVRHAECWAEDEGDFISVVCRRMVVYGLSIVFVGTVKGTEPAVDCIIPAEVEAYGTKPTPWMATRAELRKGAN